jgi:hypothetical protein
MIDVIRKILRTVESSVKEGDPELAEVVGALTALPARATEPGNQAGLRSPNRKTWARF